ncbi:dihydrofolate reductase [Rathayibacter sp. VKM Ac-2803]|uniref:dihydrofolate reductase family protein n=1 Tax=Rathayibacter sp. VKM Ac-2803 TaxID=2609256 RepID=UPI00135AC5DF|nr:dihydrofolate reductase family protein [Rathayibacter sp. VKM Ac-2803]MWV49947.1 dihydrofolate reductase [Rathayibacter sp. VKM Ac-2803]
MTRTVYYVASSLDGFIADDDDGLDWLLQFGFDAFQEHYDRFLAGVGAVVMGSTTYESVRREEPWPYSIPAWVLTSAPRESSPGADVRFADGGVTELLPAIRESAGTGDVWVVGGGVVAAQFAEASVLDELRVTVMPVLLGSGRPLLPFRRTIPLELTGTKPFAGGAVELVYRF